MYGSPMRGKEGASPMSIEVRVAVTSQLLVLAFRQSQKHPTTSPTFQSDIIVGKQYQRCCTLTCRIKFQVIVTVHHWGRRKASPDRPSPKHCSRRIYVASEQHNDPPTSQRDCQHLVRPMARANALLTACESRVFRMAQRPDSVWRPYYTSRLPNSPRRLSGSTDNDLERGT